MNVQTVLNQASKILDNSSSTSPKLDSEILLSKVIGKERKYIILNSHKKLKKEYFVKFNKLVAKRSLGKPIAYLTGKKDFWKYEFNVSEATLIPRPDTEILIDYIIKNTKQKSKLKILDIGTGSGCIAIELSKIYKNSKVFGSDLCTKALRIAKKNNVQTQNKVKFIESDWFVNIKGKFDLRNQHKENIL